ncbi:hypothetical protein [Ruegeria marina]|uniref:Uncharacterized protein n=1 Tax=Ruegeria marina TaxID=639004 RepID=A0A1G7API0_9RHOB|nr:hypothetical protein [Ruegeria marina]SDE16778.1 hypothetical protein SAMN04488239_11517 [Ruegeria marina]
MAIDLGITYEDVRNALKDESIRKLIGLKMGAADPQTGFRAMLPDITIDPAPATPSPSRTITWNMNMLVSVSEEGTRKKFQRIVGALLRAANGLGGLVATGTGLVPADAEAAVNIAINTVGDIDDILDETQVDRSLSIDQLKVALRNRQGRTVTLKARIAIDARWATDDPTSSDNKAWIEIERLKIGTGATFHANPPTYDVDDWDPTVSFPTGTHSGRSFLNSGGRRDRVGAMMTQNSTNPASWLLEAEAPIDRDQTTVNAFATVSALTWSDTVIVEVKHIILELEVDESPTDTETAMQDAERAISRFEELAAQLRAFQEASPTLEIRDMYRGQLTSVEGQIAALREYLGGLRR